VQGTSKKKNLHSIVPPGTIPTRQTPIWICTVSLVHINYSTFVWRSAGTVHYTRIFSSYGSTFMSHFTLVNQKYCNHSVSYAKQITLMYI